MSKISFIVPIYNTAEYLSACIESVLTQTYENLELILVNDGSTDASGKICDSYQESDMRVRVFHTENMGNAAARNHGLDAVTGEYITFLDSDDKVDPDFCERLLRLFETEKVDIAVSGSRRNEMYKNHTDIVTMYNNEDGIRFLIERGAGVCGKIYRAILWNGLRFPSGCISEDLLPSFDVYAKATGSAVIDRPMYYYRIRQGSITQSKFSLRQLTVIQQVDMLCEKIEKKYPALRSSAIQVVIGYRYRLINLILKDQNRAQYAKLVKQTVKEMHDLSKGISFTIFSPIHKMGILLITHHMFFIYKILFSLSFKFYYYLRRSVI